MTKRPTVSILGDSISTFAGSNPPECQVFYEQDVCRKSGVLTKNDTWWKQVADGLGCDVLVNNAVAGSCISGSDPTSGCYPGRMHALHTANARPDRILIYMGVNDYGRSVPLGSYAPGRPVPEDVGTFRAGLAAMLLGLREYYYDNVEIHCATLCKTTVPADPHFVFPAVNPGMYAFDAYNAAIRAIAPVFGCQVADLAAFDTPYTAFDGLHPDREGMHTLASLWLRALSGKSMRSLRPDGLT